MDRYNQIPRTALTAQMNKDTVTSELDARLDALKLENMYRQRRVLESPLSREVVIDGRPMLNFCSNDYLGLANDERVRQAFSQGVDRWGVGAGASHLVCGHTAAHHELEEALADFTGRPRALLYSNGYAANIGVINAVLTTGDFVFQDRLNHASLLDGGWISRAAFHWYEHSNPADLNQQLSRVEADPGRKLIVSDGTFSMDGDHCELVQIIQCATDNGAWIMIDDAHGFGVHGPGGRGIVPPDTYTTHDVQILVGTLGKAFGTFGAFVAGEAPLIETLIQKSRNYVFTTALPSAVAVATLKSLEIVRTEEWRRTHLASLIQRFHTGIAGGGLQSLPSTSPIQPLLMGDAGTALAFSQALERRGILVTAIRPPTVPEGTSRLRVTMTAGHSEDDIDRLVTALLETQAEITAN